MKNLMISILLILCISVVGSAQVGTTKLFSSDTYSNTSADTSAWRTIEPFDGLSLAFELSDSNNVSVTVQYVVSDTTVTPGSYTAIDSTNDVTGSGSFESAQIRRADGSTDNIPGGTFYRVIVAGIAASGKNSANSGATFNGWAFRRFNR